MLKYYVDENGELKSSQDSDLVVQTSKGVDTIQVTLPSDYVMASHTASVSIKNPKGVESDAYLMTYNSTDNTLTYLLNNAWFTSLKGNYEFTIRVYGTTEYTTNENGGVDLVTNSTTTIQVFTKGYYKVLEAVNVGTTPTIPTTTEEEIYKAIGEKADTTYVDSQDATLQTNIDNLSSTVNSNKEELQTNIDNLKTYVDTQDEALDMRIEAIEDECAKDIIRDVKSSSNAMQITVETNSSTTPTKQVNIALPDDVCSVDEEEDGEIPNIEVANAKYAETSGEAETSKLINNTITFEDTEYTKNAVSKMYYENNNIHIEYISDNISTTTGEETHLEKKIIIGTGYGIDIRYKSVSDTKTFTSEMIIDGGDLQFVNSDGLIVNISMADLNNLFDRVTALENK